MLIKLLPGIPGNNLNYKIMAKNSCNFIPEQYTEIVDELSEKLDDMVYELDENEESVQPSKFIDLIKLKINELNISKEDFENNLISQLISAWSNSHIFGGKDNPISIAEDLQSIYAEANNDESGQQTPMQDDTNSIVEYGSTNESFLIRAVGLDNFNLFKKSVQDDLVSFCNLNRAGSNFRSTEKEFNEGIQDYLQEQSRILSNITKELFNIDVPVLNFDDLNQETLRKQIIEIIQDNIVDHINSNKNIILPSLNVKTNSGEPTNNAKKAKIYKAFLTLLHFDDFIKLIYGKGIHIKSGKGFRTNVINLRKNKYEFAADTNYSTGFGSEVSALDQIGNVDKAIVESFKNYDPDSKTAIDVTKSNMSLNDISYIRGNILKFFMSDYAFLELSRSKDEWENIFKMSGEELLDDPDIRDSFDRFIENGDNLKTLFKRSEQNDLDFDPIVYTLLVNLLNNNIDYKQSIPKNLWRSIYSLYKNLYQIKALPGEEKSLYELYRGTDKSTAKIDYYRNIVTMFNTIGYTNLYRITRNADGAIEKEILSNRVYSAELSSLKYFFNAQMSLDNLNDSIDLNVEIDKEGEVKNKKISTSVESYYKGQKIIFKIIKDFSQLNYDDTLKIEVIDHNGQVLTSNLLKDGMSSDLRNDYFNTLFHACKNSLFSLLPISFNRQVLINLFNSDKALCMLHTKNLVNVVMDGLYIRELNKMIKDKRSIRSDLRSSNSWIRQYLPVGQDVSIKRDTSGIELDNLFRLGHSQLSSFYDLYRTFDEKDTRQTVKNSEGKQINLTEQSQAATRYTAFLQERKDKLKNHNGIVEIGTDYFNDIVDMLYLYLDPSTLNLIGISDEDFAKKYKAYIDSEIDLNDIEDNIDGWKAEIAYFKTGDARLVRIPEQLDKKKDQLIKDKIISVIPGSDFQSTDLLDGGVLKLSDLNINGNDESTELSESELFTLNFLYEFYDPEHKYIIPAVISDKPYLIKELYGANKLVKLPNGTTKKLTDLEAKDYKALIQKEIGGFYRKSFNFVLHDYQKLNEKIIELINNPSSIAISNPNLYSILGELLNTGINLQNLFNYFTNFQELNEAFDILQEKKIGNKKDLLDTFIHELIYEVQKTYPEIEFTLNLYGFWNKGSKNWEGNAVLLEQLIRFDQLNPSEKSIVVSSYKQSGYKFGGNINDFFLQGVRRMVTDLLQWNTKLDVIDTFGKNIESKGGETNRAREIAKATGYFKRGRIGFLKFLQTYYNSENKLKSSENVITCRNDIERLYFYKDLLSKFKGTEYAGKVDVRNAEFDLDFFFKAYESLKYDNRLKKIISDNTNKLRERIYSLYDPNRKVLLKKLTNILDPIQLLYTEWLFSHLSEEKALAKIDELNNIPFDKKIDTLLNSYRLNLIASLGEGIIDETVFANYLDSLNGHELNSQLESILPISELKLVYEINPELEKFNLMDYYLGQESIILTVGSHINHPAKSIKNNSKDMTALESEMYGQLTKRNVTYSAPKTQSNRGSINTMDPTIKIAIIENTLNNVYNGVGNQGEANTDDGAIYFDASYSYFENESFGSAKVGTDKKEFSGSIRPNGQGMIVKCAGFVINNDRIRTHSPYNPNLPLTGEKLIFKRMNDVPWQDDYTFWKDFKGNKIKYAPIYTKLSGLEEDKKVLCRLNLESGEFKIKSIDENTITLEVQKYKLETNSLGQKVYVKDKIVPIKFNKPKNNFELWQTFFGGEYCYDMSPEGVIELSESSISNLSLAKARVGRKRKQNVNNESNIILPLKALGIPIFATEGAIKQGASNINTTEVYNNPDYHLTYMTMDTYDFGVQLDAEHHVDQSTVSLMTLVINALGARGYSVKTAKKVYGAINGLTLHMLKDLILEISKSNGDVQLNPNFQVAVGKILIESLTSSTLSTSDSLFDYISNALSLEIRKGTNYYDILSKFPQLEDPSYLQKIVSKFAAEMQKLAVKIKFNGSQCVLVPSDSKYLLYDDKPLSEYEGDLSQLMKDELNPELNPPITDSSNLKMDRNYWIQSIEDESYVNFDGQKINSTELFDSSVLLDDVYDLLKLEKLIKSGLYKVVEHKSKGRNLSSIDYKFYDEETGQLYNFWQLAAVRDLWDVRKEAFDKKLLQFKKSKTGEEPKTDFQRYWNLFIQSGNVENVLRWLNDRGYTGEITPESINDIFDYFQNKYQETMSALGSGVSNLITVCDYDEFGNSIRKTIKINKKKTKCEPYEVVIPQFFLTDFGLLMGDSLREIETDKHWFLKRSINTINSEVHLGQGSYDVSIYNGTTGITYLKKDNDVIPSGFNVDETVTFKRENNKYYRYKDGKLLYEVPTKKTKSGIVPDVKILVDENGNELIYTNNINFFLNKIPSIFIQFSEESIKNKSKESLEEFKNDIFQTKKDSARAIINNTFLEDGSFNFNKEDINKQLLLLRAELLKNPSDETILNFVDNNPALSGIIENAISIHTSFLQSLKFIAARTPSLSHQSFMPMKVVGFAYTSANSAYVSRYLLWLLGSDFDIDKVNILGSFFNKGRYITWSDLMSCENLEVLEAGQKLAFPTGEIYTEENVPETHKPVHKFIDRDMTQSFWSLSEDDYIYKNINLHNIPTLSIYKFKDGRYEVDLNRDISELSEKDKFLLKSVLLDIINVNSEVTGTFFENFENVNGFDYSNGKIIRSNDNFNLDNNIIEYIKSIFTEDVDFNILLNNNLSGEFTEQKIEILNKLSEVLDVVNTYKHRPNTDDIIVNKVFDIINSHNNWVNTTDSDVKFAFLNFIANGMFESTSDSANNIQATTSVDDPRINNIKDIKNKQAGAIKSRRFNTASITSKLNQLRLTLTGKLEVGNIATALKVFEMMSNYVYDVLESGDDQEQLELLFDRKIRGQIYNLLANSNVKNLINLTDEVLEKVQKINNIDDAFVWLSFLLSLATDNAKDPTLAVLNAGPKMVSLYTAGVCLGVPFEDLVKIICSKTGEIIAEQQTKNCWLGYNTAAVGVDGAIQYLQSGIYALVPTDLLDTINKIHKALYNTDLDFKGKDKKISLLGAITNGYRISYDKFLKNFSYRMILNAKLSMSILRKVLYNEDYDYTIDDAIRNEILIINQNIKVLLNHLKNAQQKLKYFLDNPDKENSEERIKKYSEDIEKYNAELLELNALLTSLTNAQNSDSNIRYEAPFGNSKTTINNYFKPKVDLVKSIKPLNYESSFLTMRLIEQIEEYLTNAEICLNDVDESGNCVVNDIIELNRMASEMSAGAKLYNMNLGFPNSIIELLKFVFNFSNIIKNRLDKLTPQDKKKAGLDTMSKKELLEFVRLDLFKFVEDKDYRKQKIADYGRIKYAVNILGSLETDLHIFGYLKGFATYLKGIQAVNKHFNTLYKFIIENPIINASSWSKIEPYVNSILELLQRDLNKSFFEGFTRSNGSEVQGYGLNYVFTPTLKTVKSITNGKSTFEDINEKIPVNLSTELGRQTFVYYFENEVLPMMRSRYNNRFITDDLIRVRLKETSNNDRLTKIVLGMRVNMMPKSYVEEAEYNETKQAFEEIKHVQIPGSNLNFGLMLYLYNIITHNNKETTTSFSRLFNKSKIETKNDEVVINPHLDFIKKYEGIKLQEEDPRGYSKDELLIFTAPIVSGNNLNDHSEPYVYVKNPETNELILCKYTEKKTSQQSTQSLNRNFDDGDDYNSENYEDNYYDIDDEINDNLIDDDYEDEEENDGVDKSQIIYSIIGMSKNYNVYQYIRRIGDLTVSEPTSSAKTIQTFSRNGLELKIESENGVNTLTSVLYKGNEYLVKDLVSTGLDKKYLNFKVSITAKGDISKKSLSDNAIDIIKAHIENLTEPSC